MPPLDINDFYCALMTIRKMVFKYERLTRLELCRF